MKPYAVFLFLFLAVSCKKDELEQDSAVKASVCGVNYPIRELSWLRKMIEDAKAKKEESLVKITLVEVDGNPIFNYYISCPSCLGYDSFYCDGSTLNMTQWSFYDIFEFQKKLSEATKNTVTLWPEK